MATDELLRRTTYITQADLRAYRYRFLRPVRLADGTLGVALGNASADIAGVLYDAPGGAGTGASVVIDGMPRIELGGTVQAGDELGSDAQGRGVKLTAGGSGAVRSGIAREDGVAGQIITLRLTPLLLNN